MITFITGNYAGKRFAGEWRNQSSLFDALSDKRSQAQIYPVSRHKAVRNVEEIGYWNFYRVPSGVVMVSIPMNGHRAPPEFLVSSPTRDAARLQCIIMPVRWDRR
jgi:hypothetical protein